MSSELRQLLELSRARLSRVSDHASLDAQVLLAHVLERPRAWVLAHPEISISPEQEAAFLAALARLEAGEPLPYILGHWEFYGLDFQVTADTLIPRPETELLVEQALTWLHRHPQRRWAADIGAGSGCISAALATHVADLRVLALDISWEALQVARTNAHKHAVHERIWLVQANLLPPASRRFDLLCANLPYLPSGQLPSLAVARREPLLALDGGMDGLELIRRLLASLAQCLAPGGLALLEIEATHGQAARDLARLALPEAEIQVLADLAGLDRLLSIQTPNVL